MNELLNFEECPCSGKNLPRLLQPLIMALLAREKLHGYRILELLGQDGIVKGHSPDSAGIYRMLRNMEREGLVSHGWELQASGPPRKEYALTQKGRDCLLHWERTLIDFQATISSIISLLNEARRLNKVGS